MSEIMKTKEYTKFKLLEGNRTLERYHLRKLKESIEKDNRLNLHPIIVNKDFYVIDGQHRLEVAKQLDVEVYYIQSDSISEYHVIGCNVNQKSWEVENYIDYFSIREKNDSYIRLKNMIKSTGLKPKAILTLILGIVSTTLLEFLKTGKFKFPEKDESQPLIEFYADFIEYTKDKRIKPLSMFTNHNFTRALRWLFKTSGFDKIIFFRKLDLRWFDLKPQRNSECWYELLISIYNYKNQIKIENEYGTNI